MYRLLHDSTFSSALFVNYNSFQSLDRLSRLGDIGEDFAEILFQSFLYEALVSSSGMGRDVRSLMLSIQHLLCSPRHQPPAKVLGRMILERVSWRVACPNHGRFHLLTVARKGSCGPTKKLILLRTQSLILCSKCCLLYTSPSPRDDY